MSAAFAAQTIAFLSDDSLPGTVVGDKRTASLEVCFRSSVLDLESFPILAISLKWKSWIGLPSFLVSNFMFHFVMVCAWMLSDPLQSRSE